jgi:hypothetical protein
VVIIAVVVVIVLLYLAFHLGAGHTHYRYQKAHYTRHKSDGLRPNFYWSSVRGPYASIRTPGGFRIGHRL